MSKRVAVTGADGFIGSHLVERLLKEGYRVKALANYNSFGYKGWLECIENKEGRLSIELGDIRDRSFVQEFLKDQQTVYHLAALIGIPYSYKSAQSYVDVNVTGTLNVLESLKNSPALEKLVCTSTSETYGSAQFVPISEEHPINAQSPYAATKIAADQLSLSFHRSFGMPITILRPFNTYGPRQSCRAVIPTIISQFLQGNQIYLGNTEATRDFTFVEDTASAFIAVSKADSANGMILNAASGFEISIKDVVKVIAKIMNIDYEVIQEETRLRPKDSEVNRLFGDPTKIRCMTDWSPNYYGISGFEEGLKKTVAWYVDNKDISLAAPRLTRSYTV